MDFDVISAQPSGKNCFAVGAGGEAFFTEDAMYRGSGIDEEQEERNKLIVVIPSAARILIVLLRSITEISRRGAFRTTPRNDSKPTFIARTNLFRTTTILFFFKRQTKRNTVSVTELIRRIKFCK